MMKFKNDLFIDVFYSIVVAVIAFSPINKEFTTEEDILVLSIFKTLFIQAIFVIWFRSLSNNYNNKDWIKYPLLKDKTLFYRLNLFYNSTLTYSFEIILISIVAFIFKLIIPKFSSGITILNALLLFNSTIIFLFVLNISLQSKKTSRIFFVQFFFISIFFFISLIILQLNHLTKVYNMLFFIPTNLYLIARFKYLDVFFIVGLLTFLSFMSYSTYIILNKKSY